MEDPTSATHDTSEPTPAPETDETHDRESPDMETDDPDTMTAVPEPPPVLQSASPSLLPRHRVHGKRESAVEHERSVKPRIELPEEDEVNCRVFENKFRNMSTITVSGLTLFSRVFQTVNFPNQHPKMTATYIVFLMSKVSSLHLMCLGTIWRHCKRNRTLHEISLLPRFAKVRRRVSDSWIRRAGRNLKSQNLPTFRVGFDTK